MATAAEVANAQKAAALAAGAQGGSAGLAAYNQAAASITGARDAALADAASRSALIGASGVDATLGSVISGPTNRRLADIESAKAGVTRDYESASRAHGNYLGEVEKALPIIETLARAKGEAEAKKDAADAADKSKASELSDSEMRTRLLGAASVEQEAAIVDARKKVRTNRRQVREARDDRQVATKGRKVRRSRIAQATKRGELKFDDPVSKFVNAARGGLVEREKGQPPPRTYDRAAELEPKKTKRVLQREKRELREAKGVLAATKDPGFVTGRARQIGIDEGLDPALVYGLVGPSQEAQLGGAQKRVGAARVSKPEQAVASAANLTPRDVAQTRENKLYKNAKKALDQMVNDGSYTWEEAERSLRQVTVESGRKGPMQHVFRLLSAEYEDLFPSITQENRTNRYLEDTG
jgi:hypothetical protein